MKKLLSLMFETKHEKSSCVTCKFNNETHCTVGTHLAEQGKTGICYQGELHEPSKTK